MFQRQAGIARFLTAEWEKILVGFWVLSLGAIGIVLYARGEFFFRYDEWDHYQQILRFMHPLQYPGDVFYPTITQIPGYHTVMAGWGILTGQDSPETFRFFSYGIYLVTVGMFYLTARGIRPEHAPLKTVQFSFFPLVFPYAYFIYTDITALLFILTAFFFAFRQKGFWAAVFCVLSVLVRQTSIVWVLFILWVLYAQGNPPRPGFKNLISFARSQWYFALIFLGFGLFVLKNHGVAVGNQWAHQAGFYTENIFFVLFTAFLIFLPLHIEAIPPASRKAADFFRKRYEWKTALILLLSAAVLLWFARKAFVEMHPYNYIPGFFRNEGFIQISREPMLKWIMMPFLLWAVLFLATGPFAGANTAKVFYGISLLSLLPMRLVEVRYYLIPMIFFLLYRRVKSLKTEILLTLYFMAVSAYLFYSMRFTNGLFL